MCRELLHRVGLVVLLSGLTGVSLATDLPDPLELVEELTATGPRTPGSPGRHRAQEMLLRMMVTAGLERVGKEVIADEWTHLVGELPGTTLDGIVLSAHYDSVAGSPGIRDNATGCAVGLNSVSNLVRTPRQTGVRLILTDGEESLGAGSQEWIAGLSMIDRQSILANLDLDMLGDSAGGAGIVHILVGRGRGGRVITPGWLVHATMQAAESVDFDLVAVDRYWSWWAQLAVRCALPTRVSDGRRFLESGVPAVTLSDLALTAERVGGPNGEDSLDTVDGERLQSWVRVVAATARRLDQVAEPPAHETEYLVLGGKVWHRRDLIWVGFAIWILLVWRGLPGRWRQSAAVERRRAGRSYLPGFAFRMLFLLAVFSIPTFATLLLNPVAILALAGTAPTHQLRRLMCLAAALPTLGFAGWMAVGQLRGWFVVDSAALLPAALVGLTLVTYCAWQLDR